MDKNHTNICNEISKNARANVNNNSCNLITIMHSAFMHQIYTELIEIEGSKHINLPLAWSRTKYCTVAPNLQRHLLRISCDPFPAGNAKRT